MAELTLGHSLVFVLLVMFLVLAAVFAVDDIFVDLTALLRRLKPRKLDDASYQRMMSAPERDIAICIANWHEAEVLELMVTGNLEQIRYERFVVFLGVYPNDEGTLQAARRLEGHFPNVRVVVNPLDGPTSKGQMLNVVFREAIRQEIELRRHFELFVIQDVEDVMHPLSFKLMNFHASGADFMQIPVFSLEVPLHQLVAGTYIDEFCEIHTKDLFVREKLGAAIPSAGVGTALSRAMTLTLMSRQEGQVLYEGTLTEDYHLGMKALELGFRSRFLCYYMEDEFGRRDMIATREHFPRAFKASVNQRTRWTLGIAFQGKKLVPVQGPLGHRYFLWRDRRGPFNAGVVTLGWVLLGYFLYARFVSGHMPLPLDHPLVFSLMAFNFFALLMRLLMKVRAVTFVLGSRQALTIPLRWLIANVILCVSSLRAYLRFRRSEKTGEPPKWVKTRHEAPQGFGRRLDF